MNSIPKHVEEFITEYNKYGNKSLSNKNGFKVMEAIMYCDIYIKSNWATEGTLFRKEEMIAPSFTYPFLIFRHSRSLSIHTLNMLDSATTFVAPVGPKKKITLKQLIGEGD
jgi:hypothetical protein